MDVLQVLIHAWAGGDLTQALDAGKINPEVT